ncbi:hypothetical protein V8G54_003585 [Vigna mungo]|uniref:Uncharacterized protein n=1 Tax=Vigna mungo TaxID=3915 RepID=A0AAQ3PC13_VIGMU
MSPVLRFAPSTKTGRYTFAPLLRFFMSQFPPFSRPGIVLAASFAILSHSLEPFSIFPRRQPFVVGKFAKGRVCKTSQSLKDLTPFCSISLSLSFHMLRSSIDGAVPIIPGCVKPGNRTPGI